MRGRRVAARLLPAIAALALIAGCGGGSSDVAPEAPEPAHPIADRAAQYEAAASGSDCRDALAVTHTVKLPDPEHPSRAVNCRYAQRTIAKFSDFKSIGSEQFGTGAVVDGKAAGKDVVLIWALDSDGELKWVGDYTLPQIGTEPPVGRDFDRNANAYVEAVRAGDCGAAFEAGSPDFRLDEDGEKALCKRFNEFFFSKPASLGSRLKADPGAKPVALGGTRDIAFFGLGTDPAGYRTVIVAPSGTTEPRIIEVAPAER